MDEFQNIYQEYQEPRQPETPPVPPPKPQKKKLGSAGIVAIALCFSLLGSALGAGAVVLADRMTDTSSPAQSQQPEQSGSTTILEGSRENTVIDITTIDTGKLMTAAEVYAANVNSTVGITTSVTTNFWGYQTTSAASGSGFIISEDGYILTNFHVIEDSDSIAVSLYNGDQYDAKVIGYDENNDIAVLKIDGTDLAPVVLGDSDNLNVGDNVVAIGNPLGELTFSLTSGAISAKDREVTFSGNLTMNLLQTDCAINSGNSGGALFNLYGEVIGVTNAKYSGSSGSGASIDNIGFAIPINSVRAIAESIIEKGYVSKPYIGITMMDVSEEYQIYGLPQGAAVQSVAENSPAEEAGLQTGDIITKANGTPITGGEDLKAIISGARVGDSVTMTVYRKGNTAELKVVIGEQPRSTSDAEHQNQPPQRPNEGSGWDSFGQ